MKHSMEQHFLKDLKDLKALDQLYMKDLHVLEFGAGTGALTKILLDKEISTLESWELDLDLKKPFFDSRLTWKHCNIYDATFEDIEGRAVASFPPYQTLDFILDKCSQTKDLLLMVPKRFLERTEKMGMRCISEVSGTSFDPPSSGVHYVVVRGFCK